jgi:ring-1,2-phenylacetyl-CoA epoxidase subunit PaaE
MAHQFHQITVSAVRRLTNQAIAISFQIPPHLAQEFSYQHGQYITLRATVNGIKANRAYSLCSSPVNGEPHTIGVKATEAGLVSRFLNEQIKPGDTLELMAPMGNFTVPLSADKKRTFVLIGGGSGITPLLSIAKTVLVAEPLSTVLLLYGNRDDQSIMFAADIQQMMESWPDRFRCIHTLQDNAQAVSGAYAGLMTREHIAMLLQQYPVQAQAEYFMCGPAPMMNNAEAVLANIPKEHVHREFFTAPLSVNEAEQVQQAVNEHSPEPREVQVNIQLYGRKYSIAVEPEETILAAGIRQNLDPPYACQIAACCTCRAKLISGKVHMDSREALTDDEIEEGYVLTCQAHPLTDDVLVDYDQ